MAVYGREALAIAESYSMNRDYTNIPVLSESDAVLEFLMKEQENYSSILLNESYLDASQRAVLEAKYEVITEAVSGAIIAAIIAIFGAIAILIGKIVKMMKEGSGKVKSKVSENKKQQEESKKKCEEQCKKAQEEADKSIKEMEEIIKRKKESDDRFNKNAEEVKRKLKEMTEDVARLNRIKRNSADFYKDIIKGSDKYNSFLNSESKKELDTYFEQDEDSKFKGLSMFDYSIVINTNRIKDFTRTVRQASTDRDISGIEKDYLDLSKKQIGSVGIHGKTKADVSDILVYHLTNGYFNDDLIDYYVEDDGNPTKALVNYYNKKASTDIKFIYENYQKFLDSKIYDNAVKLQNQMNRDIEELKRTLERLKKINFNADDIKATSVDDVIKDQEEMWGELDDKEKEGFKKLVGTDGEKVANNNKARFLQNMLKVEKEAASNFSNFVKEWASLENYRLRLCNKVARLEKKIHDRFILKTWEEYKNKYGDEFTVSKPTNGESEE